MASFHLFPNTDLNLFCRVDTIIIYFSGPSGKAQRWDSALVLGCAQLCWVKPSDWSHHKPRWQHNWWPLPSHLAELGLPEPWEMWPKQLGLHTPPASSTEAAFQCLGEPEVPHFYCKTAERHRTQTLGFLLGNINWHPSCQIFHESMLKGKIFACLQIFGFEFGRE